ncbi:hypothetical protein ES703_72329 [subsurface metagenome]
MLSGFIRAQGIAHPVVEEFKKGKGLNRSTGLCRYNKEGSGGIEPFSMSQYCARIGGIENGHVYKALFYAKGLSKDFWCKAGAAHSQQ